MVDVTVEAQKFLSCIYRVTQHTNQRYGVTVIVDVLRGSKAKKILENGLERVSTYGIGMEHSAADWKHLAQQFISQRLIDQDMAYGSLTLTEQGWRLLKGEVTVKASMPEEPSAAKPRGVELGGDPILFQRLRGLRRELASAADVPPYIVFSDRALVDMAIRYPRNEREFLAVNGVGQAKLERYGAQFLGEIRAYCEENSIPPAKQWSPPTPMGGNPDGKVRRFQEVGELFVAGHSIADLQEMYGVKQSTIIGHLVKYQMAGGAVDADRVLAVSVATPAERVAVFGHFDELGAVQLSPVFEALGGAVAYEELHVLRLVYQARVTR
ncbi:MAG: RecQ family ATP-dependent DNA helicase [Caldilineaceae bacterium]|nr:RecQ family ATP-dependent DNA helicase [Caldilineaceae bacterium]